MALATKPQPTARQKLTNGGGLVGLVGLIAAAVLYSATPKEEGTEYVAYKDIAGVWTICNGDTYDVKPGQRATPAECKARLERQLVIHASPVLNCAPTLAEPGRDYQRAAFILFAYNVGTAGYCKSSAAAAANRRDWRAACDGLLKWDKARVGGVLRPVSGLTKRRKREREMCLTGIVPGATPQNLASRLDAVR